MGIYKDEMANYMQDCAYGTFVSRPMTLEILLENLRTGFYDDNIGQTKLYLSNASSTGYYQTSGTAGSSDISPVFDYWNIQLLPKSQRPVDMLFLKDLNLLWENVNAYDYHLRQTLGADAADKILCFAKKLEKIVTDEALKVWFGRKDYFVAIDNIDVDKKIQDKACLQ